MSPKPSLDTLKAAATALEGPLQSQREAIAARAKDAFADHRPTLEKMKAYREGPKGVSSIEKDAEVAAFLRERFKTRMTLGQLRTACVQRFGAERTPSEGRIGIFRQRVRRW